MTGEEVICKITACSDDVVEITDYEEIRALAAYIDRIMDVPPGTSKLYSMKKIRVEKGPNGRKWSYQ